MKLSVATNRLVLAIATLVLSLIVLTEVHALLLGQTVEYQYFFPNLATPFADADNGNKVVGAGIEVNSIALDGVTPIATGDFDDTSFTIDFLIGPITFLSAVFNGVRITDVNGTIPTFTSVTFDPITNMAGLDVSRVSFDADHIFLNWQNLPFTAGTIVKLNIIAQVPEPSAFLLLGFGLLGLLMVRSRLVTEAVSENRDLIFSELGWSSRLPFHL